jgi:hypothetical protein
MSSVHEEMKEGAREKEQPRERAEEVRPVFTQEKEGGDCEEADHRPSRPNRRRTIWPMVFARMDFRNCAGLHDLTSRDLTRSRIERSGAHPLVFPDRRGARLRSGAVSEEAEGVW